MWLRLSPYSETTKYAFLGESCVDICHDAVLIVCSLKMLASRISLPNLEALNGLYHAALRKLLVQVGRMLVIHL